MRADSLFEPERRLWMEFPYGTHIDLRTGDAERDDPGNERSWGPERVVRAEVIRDLLVGRRPVDEQQEKEQGTGGSPSVFLSGARITGQLDLRGIDFDAPLLLQQCALDEPLVIADSMSRSIRLYGCHLPGVQGSWLKCAGDLHLRDCRIAGAVDLGSAYISGQLVLSGSTLSNPGEVAVCGDGMVVAGDMFCRDQVVVEGKVSLVAARIGGELRFTRSTLRNPGKVALSAERITVEQDMYCREGFTVEGEVRLSSGHIKGQLNFDHATLHNPEEVALRADHLVVGSHLYCQEGFLADGEVTLLAARVGGEVRFSASTLSNPGGVALRADRLFVAADMYCRDKLTIDGEVSLRSAHISGQLNFNNATLRNLGRIVLDADQLVVGSHLYCHDNSAIEGGISLVAARVGGEVRFSASTLSNPGGVALCADRLVVAADMYCRDKLMIDGEVSLRGAHVAGELSFSTIAVHNPKGTAIRAEQLTVGGNLYCNEGFITEGAIDLTDVHVNGVLSLSNAVLSNPGRVALHASRLIVEKDMFCRDGFSVDGTVCLIGAHIGGKLSFTSAHLTGASLTGEQLSEVGAIWMLASGVKPIEARPVGKQFVGMRRARWWRTLLPGSWRRDTWAEPTQTWSPDRIVSGESGLALVADGLRVDIDMTCDAGFTSFGEIRLKGARIGQDLDFSDAEIENQAGTALNADDMRAQRMLMPAKCRAGRISLRNAQMIELDDKRGVRPDLIDLRGLSYERLIPPLDPETRLEWLARNNYEPQPYDQLARSYRQLGYDESARKVQIEQERRAQEDRPPIYRVWGYLQDVTIGYGYRPYRAAAWLMLVVLAGVIWFTISPPQPLDPELIPSPQFNPIFYTLDVLVPFADFGQRELWNSSFLNEVVKIILSICGWTLAITAIAGLNRILTRW